MSAKLGRHSMIAIKHAGPFRVTSRDDGTLLLTPSYEARKNVFARLQLAVELEDHLNALNRKLTGKGEATG